MSRTSKFDQKVFRVLQQRGDHGIEVTDLARATKSNAARVRAALARLGSKVESFVIAYGPFIRSTRFKAS